MTDRKKTAKDSASDAQTSNRRGAAQEHEKTVRKGYEAAQNPEPQGDGDPGPDQISEQPSEQGDRGR